MGLFIVGAIGLGIVLVSLVVGDLFEAANVFDSDVASLGTLAAFAGALGFTGAAAEGLGAGLPLAMGLGAVVGFIVAAASIALTRRLRATRTDATITKSDVIGVEGRVLTPIPAEGMGEVMLRLGGQQIKYAARSHRNLAAGERVWVTAALSATAVEVTPVEALES